MTRPVDAQRLDDGTDAQLLEIALGALSLARQVEALARTPAPPGGAVESVPGEEPALLACLGLLSLSRTLTRTLAIAVADPGTVTVERAPAAPRAAGLLR